MSQLPQETGPTPTRGWVKVVLVVSLALNVAVAGLLLGNAFAPPPKIKSRGELGLGPLAEAMTRENWRDMRPAFLAKNPDLRQGPDALRMDYDPVLAALRQKDFDAGVLQAALAQLGAANDARLITARQVIGTYLEGLSPEARLQYADRLDETLRRSVEKHRPPAAKP